MKISMTSIVFSLLWLGSLHSQNVFKANPTGLIFGRGSISVERFVNKAISVQAELTLHYKDLDGLTFSGIGGGLSGRYYFSDRIRPSGLFGAGSLLYNVISFDDIQDDNFRYSYPSVLLQIGHQWKLSKLLTLEVGAGGEYGFLSTLPDSPQTEEFFGDGFNPYLNIGIGVVF